jgi:hypothetical protein
MLIAVGYLKILYPPLGSYVPSCKDDLLFFSPSINEMVELLPVPEKKI